MNVADRLDLADLVSRLGACLDEHRFTDIHDLLVDDATISTPGGTASGRDAVVAQASRNHDDYAVHQHAFSDVLVEAVGDGSSGDAILRANAVSVWVRAGTTPEFSLGAVYRFAARRVDEGWRLSHVEVVPVWRTP